MVINHFFKIKAGEKKKKPFWTRLHLVAGGVVFGKISHLLISKGFISYLVIGSATDKSQFIDNTEYRLISGILAGIFSLAFFYIGWVLTKHLFQSIEKICSKKIIRGSLQVIFIILCVLSLGLIETTKRNSSNEWFRSPISLNKDKMEIFVSSQPSDGITENDMDQKFLKNYSDFALEKFKHGIRSNSEKMNLSQDELTPLLNNLKPNSVYEEINGKKLAVIHIKTLSSSSVVSALGIIENEIKRVICLSLSEPYISVSSGECGDKIKEVFKLDNEQPISDGNTYQAAEENELAKQVGVEPEVVALDLDTEKEEATQKDVCHEYSIESYVEKLIKDDDAMNYGELGRQSMQSLLDAAHNGDIIKAQKILNQGIYGININQKLQGYGIIFAAAEANQTDFIRWAVNKGAKVDELNGTKQLTALHIASKKGHVETVKLLLEQGANPTLKSCENLFPPYNKTPENYAQKASKEKYNVIRELLLSNIIQSNSNGTPILDSLFREQCPITLVESKLEGYAPAESELSMDMFQQSPFSKKALDLVIDSSFLRKCQYEEMKNFEAKNKK